MELLLSLIPVVIIGVLFFLWVAVLAHAMKNPIPNKGLWLAALILGSLVGGMVYYAVIYRNMSKQDGRETNKYFWIAAAVSLVAILFALVFYAAYTTPSKLKNVSFSEVIQQANSGETKTIEIEGDKILKITKQGDSAPSEQSYKEKGVSLYEAGLTNKNVQVQIKN